MTYQTFLDDSLAIRVVLVEVVVSISDTPTTIYMSNRGYVTQPDDTPANQVYTPCLRNKLSFREEINLDSTPNINFSDIFIDNENGLRDAWIDYIWANKAITVLYGDVRDDRTAFTQVFKGKVEGLDTSNRTQFKLKVRDKLQDLNKPITETLLGGATENADRLKPLCFGEVCNISPLLTNPVTHEYQYHQQAVEDIIEVRDYGYPITVTKDIANGKFTLTAQPAGTITCSIQGDKRSAYNVTIADIVTEIIKQYGGWSDSDIDTTNFSTFDAAHTQQVSYYADAKENILSIIEFIVGSVDAQFIATRDDDVQLLQIDFPVSSAQTITDSEIEEYTLKIAEIVEPRAAFKLGYCKNYTVQPDLQTGIPEKHKDLLANEWLTVTQIDTDTATDYGVESEVDMTPTALIVKTDASTEASRRLAIWKEQRKVYTFTGRASLLSLKLGDEITIDSESVDGVIIGLTPNYSDAKIDVKVLV